MLASPRTTSFPAARNCLESCRGSDRSPANILFSKRGGFSGAVSQASLRCQNPSARLARSASIRSLNLSFPSYTKTVTSRSSTSMPCCSTWRAFTTDWPDLFDWRSHRPVREMDRKLCCPLSKVASSCSYWESIAEATGLSTAIFPNPRKNAISRTGSRNCHGRYAGGPGNHQFVRSGQPPKCGHPPKQHRERKRLLAHVGQLEDGHFHEFRERHLLARRGAGASVRRDQTQG